MTAQTCGWRWQGTLLRCARSGDRIWFQLTLLIGLAGFAGDDGHADYGRDRDRAGRRSPPEPLAAGARIDYALRLHGLPVRWRTRIDKWDPPRRFVDRQVRGPFRTWVHTHTFRAVSGGTLIGDVVLFDLYCRPLARTPALGWIFADLRAIFEHRRREVARAFARSGRQP